MAKKTLTIQVDPAYFEQLVQAAIEETYKRKQFVSHIELVRKAIETAYPPAAKAAQEGAE